MAITYKDIDLLSQKASLAGTEKLPVSDTEYITPDQILDGLDVITYPSRGSESLITAGGVLSYCLIATPMTPTATVEKKIFGRTGSETSSDNYNYNKYQVTPGEVYSVTSVLSGNWTTGTICIAIWLDTNDNVLSYENYANTVNVVSRFYDVPVEAPVGAATLVVNYRHGYSISGVVKQLSPPSPLVLRKNAQALTAAEQAQVRANIGAGTSNLEADSSVSADSTNPLQNGAIRKNYFYAALREPTITEGYRFISTGLSANSNFNVHRISVSAGITLGIWSRMNVSSGSNFYLFVFTDADSNIISSHELYTPGSGTKYYYNYLLTAPPGTSYLWVNVLASYSDETFVQRIYTAPATLAAQSDWGQTDSSVVSYIKNKPTIPNITISSSEPTSSDGSDGDIWIVV